MLQIGEHLFHPASGLVLNFFHVLEFTAAGRGSLLFVLHSKSFFR
jgi:hypothetical protein